MTDPQPRSEAGQGRDLARITALLVELGRMMKAELFYPPGHRNLHELFGRVFGVWKEELQQGGALDLEIRSRRFVLTEAGSSLPADELDDLAHEFELRGVHRVRFEPDTDAEAFQTLVATMTTPPKQLAWGGGAEPAMRGCAGMALNGLGPTLKCEVEHPHSTAPSEDVILLETLMLEGTSEREGEIDPRELEESPLGIPPSTIRAESLVGQLRELDRCRVDASYDPLLENIVAQAVGLFHAGLQVETYRAMLVIGQHVADDAKRGARQGQLARLALAKLVQGPILEDLMARACAPGAESSLPAAQLLVQLGEGVVRPLFEALLAERDPERRGQLNGILIAVGATALPALQGILDSGDLHRMRVATRFCGEIQNPDAVERLADLLASQEGTLRKEAAKALARIGDRAAIEALISALDSPVPEVPALAAYCLGATRSKRAVGPLVKALDRCAEHGPVELARELIRALGRLGSEAAVDVLAAIVSRKSLLHRKRMQELKLAATTALGCLPGESALEALTQAARSTDARLREAAQHALDRRAW